MVPEAIKASNKLLEEGLFANVINVTGAGPLYRSFQSSTNAMIKGRTGSERDAQQGLADAMATADGRIAVTCFASNVARIQSICMAAQANGRSVAVVGRALNRAISAAREVGYLANLPDLVQESDIDLLPSASVVIICTGTQGEPRAAMARIAAGTHETVSLQEGDTVIYSSRQIPGNETAIARVQDTLIRRKINLITDHEALVHVSGHPSRDEMVDMYGLVRPKIAIPVHGTARHLQAHADLAKACQVQQIVLPDNGTMIRLSGTEATIIDVVHTGAMTSEKGNIIDLQSEVLRVRRRMLWNGAVTVSVILNKSGLLCAVPSVAQTGLCDGAEASDFVAAATLAVEDAVDVLGKTARRKDVSIEEVVSQAVRRVARSMFGIRPIAQVHIIRVAEEDLRT
jgi:ribonuclease J